MGLDVDDDQWQTRVTAEPAGGATELGVAVDEHIGTGLEIAQRAIAGESDELLPRERFDEGGGARHLRDEEP